MRIGDELQRTIYAALVADASVGALIGNRIYDAMPSDGEYPCVTFGPQESFPDDADCIDGEEHTIQLDVWSRSQGRLNPCKRIVKAVSNALHEAALSLADPHALVEIRVTSARVFLDPDRITAHGVLICTALVEV